MMRVILVIAIFALVSDPCWSRAVEEESVVSVYTSNGTALPDVYSQIATNIAEKITSPFYSFLGINSTEEKTTKRPRPFDRIELQETEITNQTRDVEELSADALRKTEKKPEKLTLFSSYLPTPPQNSKLENDKLSNGKLNGKLELNDTSNEIDSDFDDDDDGFGLDDVDKVETPRGPFVYFLELIGSIIQLLWGGFLAIFNPSSSSSSQP